MRHVAGMPDLHPGKGAPIGAAMTSSVLYPFLVGSDIGCGIAVFPFRLKRAVPEKIAARFPDLDVPLDPAALDVDIPAGYTDSLGTVGRGNHFVELARVATVFDSTHAERLGLGAGDLVLIVHSGSRGLGERILRAHTEVHGAGPAADPAAYLAAHDEAVRWGSLNRRLMAARVADALGAPAEAPIVDECHNSVEIRDGFYLHRKGAANGDGRDVLIAGTRGTPSFLVAGHAGSDAGFSVAHGAGRKMSRSDALRRGKAKHTVEELRRTPVGSLVVCGDRQLLFEEAPTAYKRIEQVVGDLVDHGLATRVASTVPLVTYKTADLAPRGPASRGLAPRGLGSRGLASRGLASPGLASPDLAAPDLASCDLASPDLASRDLAPRDLASRDRKRRR
ncbi:RtcB family protein [Actinoplanes palleronii]|uniref:3'-phosphate/5'-hydroxy nucleic acid ligase n=1 Tax=Actinoplanes palleronii TaxID=113570 RepID=A0ABQ4BMV3_9ACTN|nr:RtcB family protein [Actinoplanes palleronii]